MALSEEELEKIEALWDAALPGPWEFDGDTFRCGYAIGYDFERRPGVEETMRAVVAARDHVPALLAEVERLNDIARGKRYEGDDEPWPESLTDASRLRLEQSAHAETRRNLGRANAWIAHLERELHARGGPPPRIADIVEAQGAGAARPPSRPPNVLPVTHVPVAQLNAAQAELLTSVDAPSPWQKDPPTEPGRYWAIKDEYAEPDPVWVVPHPSRPGQLVVYMFCLRESFDVEQIMLWGPRLPDPPPGAPEPRDD